MTYSMKRFFIPFTICRTFNRKLVDSCIKITYRSFSPNKCSIFALNSFTNASFRVTQIPTTSFNRQKSTKGREEESDDENEFKDEDSLLSRDSKIVKFQATSMRTDLILKSALSIARNKIEKSLYESKIRLNGRKILKKNVSVSVGDEVDLIKTVSPSNSDHLHVARVEILKIEPKDDSIKITVRRFKNLLIENYAEDPYKGTTNSET